MLKNIIFDLDGTLLNSAESIDSAFKAAFRDNDLFNGGSLPEINLAFSLKENIDHVLRDDKLSSVVQQSFKKIYDDKFYYKSDLYDGAREILERLSEDYTIFLVTNKRESITKKVLTHFDIIKYFSHFKGRSDRTENFNSKSDLINDFFFNTGLNKDESIYIGDTRYDFEQCKLIGLNFIWVVWGYDPPQESARKGLNIINCWEDLDSYLIAYDERQR